MYRMLRTKEGYSTNESLGKGVKIVCHKDIEYPYIPLNLVRLWKSSSPPALIEYEVEEIDHKKRLKEEKMR